jgi:hypothetical protein
MNTRLLSDLALQIAPDLPEFFLGRLASLVVQRVASVSPMERRALGGAVFAVFLDCLELGLGAEAQVIIGQLHDEPSPVVRLVA